MINFVKIIIVQVARVFYYLCVVALQYVSPALMALFTTFLMKTLGDYAWLNHLNHSNQASLIINNNHTITKFNISELRTIFNPIVLRGLLGFINWWLVTVWFSTSTIGFVYHSYFST
jgi:PREDICTED: similar to CG7638 CG7638-PA